jgi:hypothetical protein
VYFDQTPILVGYGNRNSKKLWELAYLSKLGLATVVNNVKEIIVRSTLKKSVLLVVSKPIELVVTHMA